MDGWPCGVAGPIYVSSNRYPATGGIDQQALGNGVSIAEGWNTLAGLELRLENQPGD